MNRIATATETTTVVRIGKGLTYHLPMRGIEGVAAACGTVSRTFGAERKTQGVISCQKCLDQLAAEAAYYAEQEEAAAAAEAAPVAEEVVEAAAPIEFTEEVIAEVLADIDAHNVKVAAAAPAEGTVLTGKDGKAYTFISLSKDKLCYRVQTAEGKRIYKRISTFA